jgi:ABC-2 type transport system ATP-binding protein
VNAPAIDLASVSRWYGNVLGLSRVSLGFGPGVTALLGPNGAGKSTLLKLVTGLLRPSSGSVTVFGASPFANPEVHRRLGLVPEEEELRARVSAFEWIEYLLRLHGFAAGDARERAEKALSDVGLEPARDRRVTTFSRGMKQRLRIAQAMAHDPDVLVLDEPLTGLDPVGRREVIDWIRGWGARGKTVLVSSHILHEVELMTREVVLMTAGKVMASGNIHEIRRLIDAHPHHIAVSTPEPRELAAYLLGQDGLHSISFSEELSRVELETREPDRFYVLLSDYVLDRGGAIHEITSPDDNLEAVFHYLVEGR